MNILKERKREREKERKKRKKERKEKGRERERKEGGREGRKEGKEKKERDTLIEAPLMERERERATMCYDTALLLELRDQRFRFGGFPGGAVVESLPANAGDTGSSPGLGRSHMPQSN